MKRILCVVIFIITIITLVYLLIPSQPKIKPDEVEKNPMVQSFRDEIKLWTSKANGETNVLKSSIYRSYAMSNLYFLQPYISASEYSSLSLKIGEVLDPRVPRYINPEMVLAIVQH